MPRLEGLAFMYAGDFAGTLGLGANGLANPAGFSRAEIRILDRPCTKITATDSGPVTCIRAGDDGPTATITAASSGSATEISIADRPATIITAADGKDG